MVVLLFFIIALAYAILRYVGVGPVSADHIPLYVVNKAIAFTALSSLAAALLASTVSDRLRAAQPGGWMDPVRLGVLGTWLALAHGAASFLILSPAYHPKLFGPDGTMIARAEGSMLAAVLAVAALVIGWPRGDGVERQTGRAWRYGVVLLGITHAALQGFPGWLQPSSWHGSLPPITLLSAVLAAGLFVAALRLGARRGSKR